MPQLDVNGWPPQLFWLAITFITLYIVISRYVVPRTGGVIEARKTQVASDLAAAQKLKSDTDSAIAAYEASLAEARQKAHAIGQEVREKLGAETDKERARLDGQLAQKIADAEKLISDAKTKALADVHQVASDIAGDITASLTGIKAGAADIAAAVDRAAGK
ncbi:MAG: ATP F0F1 synthase subunit B [Rhizobiales bacterium]|nr:ATP F0F1 synthase subunit B [Hyphomicrobiales bacterium]